ncbi:MAG: Stp1/IreP family PP2C-type Ser/Thr phosphatase, partial [Gemmatimonadetes bacterium]|nr:Stp1/IreP family PP2C-type Ser/Thr phosphatase [Gemmatimonadota bacterium]
MTDYVYLTGNATDTGRERAENQDYFGAYEDTPYGDLWVVCDGMGGAAGGRIASVLAVEAVREAMMSPGQKDEVSALLASVASANEKVFRRAQADPKLEGMGTTLVALLLRRGKAFVAHVGDSRAYHIRNGHLQQVTRDHTMVQEMLDDGVLTIEQARTHPDGHIITRSVGIASQVKVDVDLSDFAVAPEDRWILCTDGLTGMVSDEVIRSIAGDLSPSRACRTMVTLANEAGGPDNITVQVVEVLPEPVSRLARLIPRFLQPSRRVRWRKACLLATGLFILGIAAAVSWLALYEQDTPAVEEIPGAVVGEDELTAPEAPSGGVDTTGAEPELDNSSSSDRDTALEDVGASNATELGDESATEDTSQQVDSNELESR